MNDGALVLGSDYRGLGVAQSLGRHGVPVVVLHEQEGSVPLATYSRYVKKVIPFPADSESVQVEFLAELADREALRGWTLLPTRDDTAAFCSRHADALGPHFRLSVSPWEVLRRLCDKQLGHQLAADVGVPYPRTWQVNGNGVGALDCEFPVVIKPSVKREINPLTLDKAWRADDRDTLRRRYDEAAAFMDPNELLVQEWIPGGGEGQLSFAALADSGRAIATLVARRTRQYPMDFGRASTFVETIDDPEVAEFGKRFLAASGYTGVIEIEFKRDPRTRMVKLLDLNPRFWGWHSLGRRAGTDFPWLLWRLVHGDTPDPVEARPGVRWMWLAADVPVATRELLGRRLRLRRYLGQFRGPISFGTFTFDDPVPGLAEVPLHVTNTVRHRVSGKGGSRAAGGVPVT
jgi:D-aspartate ligase